MGDEAHFTRLTVAYWRAERRDPQLPVLTVTDLLPEERQELVKTKLSQYHKTLTATDVRPC